MTLRLSSGALAIGGIVGGIVVNSMAEDEFDRYEAAPVNTQAEQDARKKTENLASTRNLLYILGGVGLSGFAVTLFF